MLDRGVFDILRNGCIDPLPARSNDLWTDLVIEPLTGNSNDKFDGRKFNWNGTANGIHDPPMLAQRGHWVNEPRLPALTEQIKAAVRSEWADREADGSAQR
jgi:hypothetical protein